ncbi:hypothetical protein ACE2AJ_20875 [Aquihabitans daechungensis]|uniref:hypothetical protein n=1 Tax=Aquihabitans daechungensis TaxID=1052257 RepID=UPI003BA1820D
MSGPLSEVEGRNLLVADAVGTAALALVTVASALTSSDAVVILNLVVAGALFLGGCLGFGIGFLRAVGRSRTETVDLAGLFYLTGSAPTVARRAFLGLWFAQIAIAAIAIPLTDPPFAVMAPVWGIGIITWWASAHATFPPRQDGRGN